MLLTTSAFLATCTCTSAVVALVAMVNLQLTQPLEKSNPPAFRELLDRLQSEFNRLEARDARLAAENAELLEKLRGLQCVWIAPTCTDCI